jgi:phosphoheptose isomerase
MESHDMLELAKLLADKSKKHLILICGNGGLAATAEHFAAESVGKFAFDCYIPCIALTANSSIVTALSNDLGFDNVFSHQVKVMGRRGDVLIAMTTSQSTNILKALAQAKENDMVTIAICGVKSKDIFADYVFRMRGEDTAKIQESAIKFLHELAYAVKREIKEC